MPATCLSSISVNHIRLSYIVPFDPEGHAMETTAHAWSWYNHHLFRQQQDNRMVPYPTVDTVYERSATDHLGDNMFVDLFLDDMFVVVELIQPWTN
jgi:hypothetical protein